MIVELTGSGFLPAVNLLLLNIPARKRTLPQALAECQRGPLLPH